MNAALLNAAVQQQAIARFQAAGATSRDTALPLAELELALEGPVQRLLDEKVVRRELHDEHGDIEERSPSDSDRFWYDHGAALDYQDGQHGKLIIGFVMAFLLVAGTWATYLVLTTMG